VSTAVKINRAPLAILERAHFALPRGRVSIGWLQRALDEQAVYLLIFVFALAGALPAASLPAGLAICALSVPMMLSRRGAFIPDMIARREIGSGAVRFAMARAIAALRFCQRIAPLGKASAMTGLRAPAGALLFVLGATLLVPIPLSNVLPALSAAIVVLALIEGRLMLFALGVLGGLASIVLTGEAVIAGVRLAGF
jgi:hypothetical protein